MIDPKYLDMLKKSPSVSERLDAFLTETIDNVVTCAICDTAEQPLPPELGYSKVHIGYNRLSKRKLIVADTSEGHCVHVEFSDDYKAAFVAKRNFAGFERVELSPETSQAVRTVYETLENKILELAYAAMPDNPKLKAISDFLAETRYGTNEYLCSEYLHIYERIVNEMLSQIENEEIKDTARDALLKLKVEDIRQFLENNGIDPDTVGVHVI